MSRIQSILLICFIFIPGLSIGGEVAWSGPATYYVGFPGASTNKYAFLSKYCTHFIANTGEEVRTSSIDIIDPKKTYVIEFSEIIKPANCSLLERSWNYFWRVRTWKRQVGATILTPPTANKYSIAEYGVDRNKVNMGQSADIATIDKHLKIINQCNELKRFKTVWLAYSRGVMAIVRYFTTMGKDSIRPDALILEGGPDSIPHFLSHLFDTHIPSWLSRFQKPSWVASVLLFGFRKLFAPSYKPCEDRGLAFYVMNIPKEIPVLLVASYEDELVSYRSVIKLYQAFKKARGENYSNVHLLILTRARHSYYVNGVSNPLDRDRYQQVVHAFYKKYGLAYDEKLASLGKDDFDKADKVAEEAIGEKLSESSCECCRNKIGSSAYFYE